MRVTCRYAMLQLVNVKVSELCRWNYNYSHMGGGGVHWCRSHFDCTIGKSYAGFVTQWYKMKWSKCALEHQLLLMWDRWIRISRLFGDSSAHFWDDWAQSWPKCHCWHSPDPLLMLENHLTQVKNDVFVDIFRYMVRGSTSRLHPFFKIRNWPKHFSFLSFLETLR